MLRKEETVPIILSILPTGSENIPRYRIFDQYGRVWSGDFFSADEHDAMTFENSRDAAEKVQDLLLIDNASLPVHRRYTIPITLDLFSEREVPMKALMEWLSQCALFISPNEIGNGPVEGSLGLMLVDWNKMTKAG